MRVSGYIGILLAFGLLLLAIAMGTDLAIFLNIPSLIITFGWASLITLASFGGKGFASGFSALGVLFSAKTKRKHVTTENLSFLKAYAHNIYIGGGLGVIVGLIQMLANLSDPSVIGPAMAVTFLSIFYAFLFAELIFMPAFRRLQVLHGRLVSQSEDSQKMILDTEPSSTGKIVGFGSVLIALLTISFLMGSFTSESDEPIMEEITLNNYRLPELLVNVNTTSGKPKFAKIRMTLNLKKDVDIRYMEKLEPQIVDTVLLYLKGLEPDSLEGKLSLEIRRGEIHALIVKLLPDDILNKVLFEEVLVQ